MEALCLLDKPVRPNDMISIKFKMVDGFGFDIGICTPQNELSVLLRDVGYCFYNGGDPAWLYKDQKVIKRYGVESNNQGQVIMYIDAAQGVISYNVNDKDYGEAFTGIDFINNLYYPAVSSQYLRIVEIVDMQSPTFDVSL